MSASNSNQIETHLESISSALVTGTDNEKRIKCLNNLRVALESSESEASQSRLFELTPSLTNLLKLSLESSNAHLSFAALSCLPVFLNKLSALISDLTTTTTAPPQPIPILLRSVISSLYSNSSGSVVSLLGDSKQRTRELARSCLIALACLAFENHLRSPQSQNPQGSSSSKSDETLLEIERIVKEQALANKVARARAQAVYYLSEIRGRYPSLLSIRSYLPTLVSLLEDSDASVRSAASESIIKIFSAPSLPGSARADLKNELAKQGTRKTTVDSILNSVFNPQTQQQAAPPSTSVDPTLKNPPDSSLGTTPSIDPPSSNPPPGSSDQPASNLPPPSNSAIVQPIFVSGPKELENIFAKMLPPWEGKETEHNWQAREANVTVLRGMIKTNVHLQHTPEFIIGLRSIADGLLKSLASLRTTMAVGVCTTILELTSLGAALDPLVEIFLPALLQMAGQTKKIVFQASQASALAIIRTTSYHSRTLQFLLSCTSEKTVQARGAGIGLIKEFIDSHGQRSKGQIESGGGWAYLEKALRKSLGDASPVVRQTAREVYWTCSGIWPGLAETLIDSLDPTTRKQLEKAATTGAGSRVISQSSSIKSTTSQRVSVRSLIKSTRENNLRNSENSNPSLNKKLPPTSLPTNSPLPKRQVSVRRMSEKVQPSSSTPLKASQKLSSSTSSLAPGHVIGTPDRMGLSPSKNVGDLRRVSLAGSPGRSRSSSDHSLLSPTTMKSNVGPRTPLNSRTPLTPPRSRDFLGKTSMSPGRRFKDLDCMTSASLPTGRRSGELSEKNFTQINTTPPSLSRKGVGRSKPNEEYMIEEALKAQAEQAESAAHRLLELSEDYGEPFVVLGDVGGVSELKINNDLPSVALPKNNFNDDPNALSNSIDPQSKERIDRTTLSSARLKNYSIDFENSPRSGLIRNDSYNVVKNSTKAFGSRDSVGEGFEASRVDRIIGGSHGESNNNKDFQDYLGNNLNYQSLPSNSQDSWWHRQAEFMMFSDLRKSNKNKSEEEEKEGKDQRRSLREEDYSSEEIYESFKKFIGLNKESESSDFYDKDLEVEINLKISRIFYRRRSNYVKEEEEGVQEQNEKDRKEEAGKGLNEDIIKNLKFWNEFEIEGGVEEEGGRVKFDEIFEVLKSRLNENYSKKDLNKSDELKEGERKNVDGDDKRLIDDEKDLIVKDSQLVLFRSIILYQNNLILGKEIEIFEILLNLIDRFGFKKSNIITAVEALGSLWTEITDPIYGLSCLRICIENLDRSSLNSTKSKKKKDKDADLRKKVESSRVSKNGKNGHKNGKSGKLDEDGGGGGRGEEEDEFKDYWLGLSMNCLREFLMKLPMEIIEEELLKSNSLIKRALNHKRSEIRMKGVNLLKGCNMIFKDFNEIIKILIKKSPKKKNGTRRMITGKEDGEDVFRAEGDLEEGGEGEGYNEDENAEDEDEDDDGKLNEAQEALLTYYLN